MVVQLENTVDNAVSVRPGFADRIASHLLADRIDRELAAGGSPDATPATALRAHKLVGARSRRSLARGLQRVLDEAANPLLLSTARLPLNRARVLRAADDFDRLSQELASDRPVSVHGVAQVRILLTEGSGPLRGRGSGAELGPVVRRTIEALNGRQSSVA